MRVLATISVIVLSACQSNEIATVNMGGDNILPSRYVCEARRYSKTIDSTRALVDLNTGVAHLAGATERFTRAEVDEFKRERGLDELITLTFNPGTVVIGSLNSNLESVRHPYRIRDGKAYFQSSMRIRVEGINARGEGGGTLDFATLEFTSNLKINMLGETAAIAVVYQCVIR